MGTRVNQFICLVKCKMQVFYHLRLPTRYSTIFKQWWAQHVGNIPKYGALPSHCLACIYWRGWGQLVHFFHKQPPWPLPPPPSRLLCVLWLLFQDHIFMLVIFQTTMTKMTTSAKLRVTHLWLACMWSTSKSLMFGSFLKLQALFCLFMAMGAHSKVGFSVITPLQLVAVY